MQQQRFMFNGVNGATGEYLLPAMTPGQVSALAQVQAHGWNPRRQEHLRELRWWHEYSNHEHWGPQEGIDPRKLEESGWGVIFSHDADSNVKKALSSLLDLRREQATHRDERYYREYSYQAGESKIQFLSRNGSAPGRPADPNKIPYYLLLVGPPSEIPFRFQYQLDLQYAVGRIAFDKPEEYECYAKSVVRAERGAVNLPRKAIFFGVDNGDRATRLSHDHLVKPRAESLAGAVADWDVETVLGERATKVQLLRHLGGDDTPSLLFTASHGLGFPNGHPRQLACQGALLCSDWPGPGARKLSLDHCLAAAEVADDARPLGLISFHFACFGGGTPELESFAKRDRRKPAVIAPYDFVARLPQRLLGHPQGGALAVVGHADRAWGYSFLWPRAGEQTQVFEGALKRLLKGYPVGSAMEFFDQSYAELSSDLAEELEEQQWARTADDQRVSGLWTARNDARNYVVLGDPAVRLPASD